MIALLAAERVKLLSTRSPWWCAALSVALVVGFTILVAATAPPDFDVAAVAAGLPSIGVVVMAAMGAAAVTVEYRYSTIRLTFAAVPGRSSALLAKAAVVAVAAGAVGLVTSAASRAVVWALWPARTALTDADRWRTLLAAAPVFAVAAVLAVALGILVRHTAVALAVLLVWALLAENLVTLIPHLGPRIRGFLPFANLDNVLQAAPDMPFGPWGSLLYVAAVAVGLLTLALVATQLRDA